jgi:hypothetical protein
MWLRREMVDEGGGLSSDSSICYCMAKADRLHKHEHAYMHAFLKTHATHNIYTAVARRAARRREANRREKLIYVVRMPGLKMTIPTHLEYTTDMNRTRTQMARMSEN